MQNINIQIQNDLIFFLKELGINIKTISFIPIGEESYAWRILTKKKDIFLKYCTKKEILNTLPKINKLLLQLSNYDFIVPPIVLNGKTEIPFQDGYIYAYPYVEGNVITIDNADLDKDIVKRITEIMGEIHSTNIENFDIEREKFEYDFRKMYEDIKNGRDIPEVSDLDMEKLDRVIQEFEDINNKYRDNNPDMVLTHGDITGSNILLDKNSNIKLLDWDGVKIAPKERDINFLFDNPNFDFKYYQSISNSNDFILEIRDYYNYIWALDSILENMYRLQNYIEDYGRREYLLEDINEYLGYY